MQFRKANLIIYTIFGLSGFSALVYEILWTKHLSLTFGTSMLAISTVAATFMAGLALGSFLLGRRADRSKNLLRLYAWLELGIAASAVLFLPALGLVTKAYTNINLAVPATPALTTGFNILFSALLLLAPTICMGGTFPVMCRLFARKQPGSEIGRLYAINTLGAILGTMAAGFFLIPRFGLSWTALTAVGINLGVAAIAFALSLRITEGGTAAPSARGPRAMLKRLPVVVAALTGFFALAYQILWTRVLLLFLGNTSYAFATILGVFLAGLALGGASAALLMRRHPDPERFFLPLAGLMGASILATCPFYDRLAFLFQAVHEAAGGSWWLLSVLSFGVISLVMLVPTVISGAILPLAVHLSAPGRLHAGEGVGTVVLYNTLGAVAGSLLAGFAFIPLLGLQKSFFILALGNLCFGLILHAHRAHRLRLGIVASLLLTIGLLPLRPSFSWDQNLINSGVYYYANRISDAGGLDQFLQSQRLLETYVGLDATVAVRESPDGRIRFLSVNGKTDAGTQDMETQLLLGHLPLLLHPDPQSALVIGLGSGITLGAAADHPLHTIDCVEISEAVVKASVHFEKENHSALRDPRVELHLQDARNYLLTGRERYDVITSEPSNPWQAGNANLFTTEFYSLAAEHLHEDGIFCQWIPLYDVPPEHLRVICRTFIENFPYAMAFSVQEGYDLLLIGARRELVFDYLQMRQRMKVPAVGSSLASIGTETPGDLIGRHYLFSEQALASFSRGARLNTDDRPILEYSYRDIFQPNLRETNLAALRRALDRQNLPVVNAGMDMAERTRSLVELADGFAKGGRSEVAKNLLETIRGKEDSPAEIVD